VDVRTTFLGAHAVPPEFAGRTDDIPDEVLQMLPALHALGLVDAVDAFCERIAFSTAQTQRVFEAAQPWACRSSCMPSNSATAAAPSWPRGLAR
jgi:imidazolonepropionase